VGGSGVSFGGGVEGKSGGEVRGWVWGQGWRLGRFQPLPPFVGLMSVQSPQWHPSLLGIGLNAT
jgi:hypothetical protein